MSGYCQPGGYHFDHLAECIFQREIEAGQNLLDLIKTVELFGAFLKRCQKFVDVVVSHLCVMTPRPLAPSTRMESGDVQPHMGGVRR